MALILHKCVITSSFNSAVVFLTHYKLELSLGNCPGSRVRGRGLEVEGRGLEVEGRKSRVEDCKSRVEGLKLRVACRGS